MNSDRGIFEYSRLTAECRLPPPHSCTVSEIVISAGHEDLPAHAVGWMGDLIPDGSWVAAGAGPAPSEHTFWLRPAAALEAERAAAEGVARELHLG